MPVYLGIDYGTKRIGLAWADELGISLPLESIPGVDLDICWKELVRVVAERKINEFVVGYPIQMDGKVGKRANEVDLFINKLSETFELPVHKVDERLTTVAAVESLSLKPKGKNRGKFAEGRIDATAASLILRDFLEQKGG